MDLTFLLRLIEIVWINILLSGDNAVVIALACRSLPPLQRRYGILLGAGAAILLRILFTIGMMDVLHIPWLKLAGGALLVWIAVRLVINEHKETSGAGSSSLWKAIYTIAIADVIMSLDNVVAIAAAAQGSMLLIILGLCLSVPIIMLSAEVIGRLLKAFPVMIWLGAAMLGSIAGELIVSDPSTPALPATLSSWPVGGLCGTVLVLLITIMIRRYTNEWRRP